MKNFVFINSEKALKSAKHRKKKQVILGNSFCDEKSIKLAKESGFSVWVRVEKTRKISVGGIASFAGRAEKGRCTICAVTEKSFEKALSAYGKCLDYIDGFILPAPEVFGVLWNKDMERLIADAGDIYDIFDEEVAESHIRPLYFEAAENQLISRYVKPVCQIAERFGKKVCFCMKGEIQYDFLPHINPLRLIYQGIPVVFENASPETDAFLSSGKKKKILLIKPVRGALIKYVHTNIKRKVRLENPALCASYEGTYLCDRFNALGKSFTAVDEYTFENYAKVENRKIKLFWQNYEKVIVCESCSFSGKSKKLFEDAKKSGVSVNSRELLQEILADVMEEQ